MLIPMNLNGKTALITGAGRRIGRVIALTLAQNGCSTALHCHKSLQETEELAAAIKETGISAQVFPQDLTRPEQLESWYASVVREIGPIDILINSASEYSRDSYSSLEAGKLQRSMALHLLSPLALIHLLFNSMSSEQRNAQPHSGPAACAAVNILDTRVKSADREHASYHLGKSALAAASRELALELAPAMRINAVAPGIILPPPGESPLWLEKMKLTNPLLSRGYPEDVAEAVLFLCRSDFITGQTIYVDGGRHLLGMR